MIYYFLYKMDEKNKRAITGMVVDDNPLGSYDPTFEYKLVLDTNIVLKEGQKIVSNSGTQYYGVIAEESTYRYLNLNDYMLTMKIDLTDRLTFAKTASVDMLDELVFQTSNFNEETELDYVEAGYSLMENGSYRDYFDILFKKVKDNVYCELLDYDRPMFIGREDNDYVLTDDFGIAYRILQREVRPLLVTRGYVNKQTDKKNLAFSMYNVFSDSLAYGFAGGNSFVCDFTDEVLTIKRPFNVTNEFRLVNDERRSKLLKDILYAFKHDKTDKYRYLMVDNKYIAKINQESYKLVENASQASLIEENEIDAIKGALSLFAENLAFKTLEASKYFCYETEQNNYYLTDEKLEYKSHPISEDDYDLFLHNFKTIKDNKTGVILFSLDSYLKMNLVSNQKFSIEFVDSGLEVTVFTKLQAELIINILASKLKKREIVPMVNTIKEFKLVEEPLKPLVTKYDEFLEAMKQTSIRFNDYPILDEIKTSSDKNAYEYLKCLYPKTVQDSYGIFKLLLKNKPEIKNILIAGGTANCDILGLAKAASFLNHNVTVTTIDTVRWGYFPICEIGTNLKFIDSYRLPFASLPKSFLNQFDLVYFGKSFDEDVEALKKMFASLHNYDKKIYFAATGLCEIGKFKQSIYHAIKNELDINRKYFNFTLNDYCLKNASLDEISYDQPIISNKVSYFMLFKLENKQFFDLFKKK